MAVQYRIGEFSQLAGVSVKTLRFYDEIGLLRPAAVDPRTRYRHYLAPQLQELAAIVALKNFGVSLAEIRALIRRSSRSGDHRALLKEARISLEHSIQSAIQSLKWIDAAIAAEESRPVSIVVKHRPETPIASIRAQIRNYTEIIPLEQELLNTLPSTAISGLRGVLWHRCADSGSLEGEPFIALKHEVRRSSAYDLGRLPAATLACAYSDLDDETSERTYMALRKWIAHAGYSLAGPKRELNLGELLEIQFPLKSS